MGSESRTLVPPNRTNRSSPGSSIGLSLSSGALSDASARIAHVVRGLLRSEKNGLSHSLCERGFCKLQPAAVRNCCLVAECGLVHGWGICGSGPYDVALGVCENLLWQYLPSGDCDFSCTQIGDNSGCLDARSLTLLWYCLGVGRSAKAETYVTTLGIEFRGIEADAHKYISLSNFLHLNSIEAQSFD